MHLVSQYAFHTRFESTRQVGVYAPLFGDALTNGCSLWISFQRGLHCRCPFHCDRHSRRIGLSLPKSMSHSPSLPCRHLPAPNGLGPVIRGAILGVGDGFNLLLDGMVMSVVVDGDDLDCLGLIDEWPPSILGPRAWWISAAPRCLWVGSVNRYAVDTYPLTVGAVRLCMVSSEAPILRGERPLRSGFLKKLKMHRCE